MKNHCVIFDLDGTLAATIKDIAGSVNRTRHDYGLPELPIDQVVSYTGDGARKLLERSFRDHPIDLDEGLKKMIRHYYAHPAENTSLYPGVAEGLAALKAAGWKLACATNKPGLVAREILKSLQIDRLLDDIIGGNDGFPLKPDPAVMFHLMKKYDAEPADSWVLGDNHTDLDSASNAGMNGAYATWGYGFPADAVYKIKVDSFEQFTQILLKGQ
ncbi:MAG: HAD hydrolase-like protein [Lentisphaeria bacterium]|nr:HAD hydrolase-like protein [Lentisphaeria bacterium]